MLDSRRLGTVWTLDRLWERLGIGTALRAVAAGRRLDGEAVERVCFALVAQWACEPGSKQTGTGGLLRALLRSDGLGIRRPGRCPAQTAMASSVKASARRSGAGTSIASS